MNQARGLLVKTDADEPVLVGQLPTDFESLYRYIDSPISIVECNDEVVALASDQPSPFDCQRNPRATRAATMLIPQFGHHNVFLGTVIFFGVNSKGEFVDLQEKWKKRLFPHGFVEEMPAQDGTDESDLGDSADS